jgi:hypothetical protein
MARGIDARRVTAQACDQLATEIESGPDSPKVRAMIDDFIRQASVRLADPNAPVYAALCCTHFGYARGAFRHSLDTHIGQAASILNPNESMSADFFERFRRRPCAGTEIDLKVVSRILWGDRKVTAIAGLLNPVSPVTAQALVDYRHDPQLFSF